MQTLIKKKKGRNGYTNTKENFRERYIIRDKEQLYWKEGQYIKGFINPKYVYK